MTLPSGILVPDERIADICRHYKIREMSVFGSAARGSAGPDSDIDILVDFQPDAHLGWEFFNISDDLERVFGRKVDLGTKDSLKAYARSSALRDALVIYAAG